MKTNESFLECESVDENQSKKCLMGIRPKRKKTWFQNGVKMLQFKKNIPTKIENLDEKKTGRDTFPFCYTCINIMIL